MNDLPTDVSWWSYLNGVSSKWSREELQIFDNHREEYGETFKLLQAIKEFNRAPFPVKCRMNINSPIPKSHSVITAFYIPTNISNFKLMVNDQTLSIVNPSLEKVEYVVINGIQHAKCFVVSPFLPIVSSVNNFSIVTSSDCTVYIETYFLPECMIAELKNKNKFVLWCEASNKFPLISVVDGIFERVK